MNDSNTPTAAEVLLASTCQTVTPTLVIPGHAQTLDNAQHMQGTINKTTGVNKSAGPKQLNTAVSSGARNRPCFVPGVSMPVRSSNILDLFDRSKAHIWHDAWPGGSNVNHSNETN